MNERIKELLVDNKDIFSNGVTESNGEVYIHGSQDNLQKFAELIVKECAEFVGKQRNDIPACGFEFEVAIKEHFGVE